MDVLVKKNFITADDCLKLSSWVDVGVENKWLDKGVSRGSQWEYGKRLTTRNYGDRFEYPSVAHEVFKKITDALDLHGVRKSSAGGGRDGIVVSCTFPGGDVYKHTDPLEGKLQVLRCNIMTRPADAGGELFVNDQKINVGVGDLHCYLASNSPHYVTEVKGSTPRVLWMFGYQFSFQDFDQLKEQFAEAQCS
jgi:hypothetical protein